jgi:outer membrane protein assembly factor BamD
MFKQPLRNLLAIFSLLVLFSSCSSYQKLLKSDDLQLKKDKAIEYYEKGDYQKSLTLITDIIPAYRGTADAENLNYYYAMAHYKLKDYIMAAHYFKTFTQGFPRSEHVEEFLFLSAYCKYLLSPRPTLDQTETRDAINELQAFINRFPQSEKVAEANELIDELRDKLETKAFNTAMLYFNLMDYEAAVTSFNNVIRDYPDTEYREESLFYIIRSHFLFAENSIVFRQLERYKNVVDAHDKLIRRFPESKYLSDANSMLLKSQQIIEALESSAANSVPNDQIN